MDNRNILINHARLKRHYEANLKSYDEIALLDLSHALRMWMDMKDVVNEYLLSISSNVKFKSFTVSKQLSRLVANKEYILAGLPGGVSTTAGNPEILTNKRANLSKPFTIGTTIKRDFSDKVHVSQIAFINNLHVSADQAKILQKGLPEKSYNFLQWLSSDIVRVSYPKSTGGLERKIISREVFVGRVANILGGSHPMGVHDSENQFNDAVHYLMESEVLGLPTPYFLLLKMAKDILDNITVPIVN